MKTRLLLIFLTISLFSFAQNGQKTVDETIATLINAGNVSYFEVSKEMFQILSESKGASPEYKEYISKLSKLKMIKPIHSKEKEQFDLYENFIVKANLKDFSKLMTSIQPNRKITFYKKKGKKSDNEFLLISSETIIYVTGTLDMKSISEFEQIMEIAGSAFEM